MPWVCKDIEAANDSQRGKPSRCGHGLDKLSAARYVNFVAKVFFVTFKSLRFPKEATFVVVAEDERDAVDQAWKNGGAEFHENYSRPSGQAAEMQRGAHRIK
jgi:hypothetical protein